MGSPLPLLFTPAEKWPSDGVAFDITAAEDQLEQLQTLKTLTVQSPGVWSSSRNRHSWTNYLSSPLLIEHLTESALDKAATAGRVALLIGHSTAAALDKAATAGRVALLIGHSTAAALDKAATAGRVALLIGHSTAAALDKAATAGRVALLIGHSTAAALDTPKLTNTKIL